MSFTVVETMASEPPSVHAREHMVTMRHGVDPHRGLVASGASAARTGAWDAFLGSGHPGVDLVDRLARGVVGGMPQGADDVAVAGVSGRPRQA